MAAVAAEFLETYAAANNKPSDRAANESILRLHPLQAFGDKRCDEIRTHTIESLKAEKLQESRVEPKAIAPKWTRGHRRR